MGKTDLLEAGLEGAPMGKDVEEPQELPVNPAPGRHDTWQKGVGGARPCGVWDNRVEDRVNVCERGTL